MGTVEILKNVCRICLKPKQLVCNIYDFISHPNEKPNTLATMLSSLTSIENTIADKFSVVLCDNCADKLISTVNFMKMVSKSDEAILLLSNDPYEFCEQYPDSCGHNDEDNLVFDGTELVSCPTIQDESETADLSHDYDLTNFNDLIEIDSGHTHMEQDDTVIYLNESDNEDVIHDDGMIQEDDDMIEVDFASNDNSCEIQSGDVVLRTVDVSEYPLSAPVQAITVLGTLQPEQLLLTESKHLKRKSPNKRPEEEFRILLPKYEIVDISQNELAQHHQGITTHRSFKTVFINTVEIDISEEVNITIPEPQIGLSYVCKYCPKAYSTPYHLIYHLRRSHVCHFCFTAFESTADLNKHTSTLHADNTCLICDIAYASYTNLRAHQKKMHNFSLPPYVGLIPAKR